MKFKFIESSKILKGNKITLKADLVAELKVKEGDKVIFEKSEDGRICIRKG